MAQRTTIPEDIRIDRLARALYGTEIGGTVEALLDANCGLAALIAPSGVIPAGTVLLVPDAPAAPAAAAVRPWL